jgi:hypothetical protein
VGESKMKCTSCSVLRELAFTNKNSLIIEAMGIPSEYPNALELARLKLEQFQKKDIMIDKIRNLIDSE